MLLSLQLLNLLEDDDSDQGGSSGHGRGGQKHYESDTDNRLKEFKERILKEDEEILYILKAFIISQN